MKTHVIVNRDCRETEAPGSARGETEAFAAIRGLEAIKGLIPYSITGWPLRQAQGSFGFAMLLRRSVMLL